MTSVISDAIIFLSRSVELSLLAKATLLLLIGLAALSFAARQQASVRHLLLAATFAALGVIPIMFLVQLAFIVAFGVLLDTVLVRSLLVPALAYDLGRHIWWPSRLGRADQPVPAGAADGAGEPEIQQAGVR